MLFFLHVEKKKIVEIFFTVIIRFCDVIRGQNGAVVIEIVQQAIEDPEAVVEVRLPPPSDLSQALFQDSVFRAPASPATFGPPIWSEEQLPSLNYVVYPAPLDACTSLVNPAVLRGRIALIVRGGCSFSEKIERAAAAGAAAVIVMNNGTDTKMMMIMLSLLQQWCR